MDNKWDNIRIAIVVFVCVFGMATCHGIDNYAIVKKEETKARQAEAERDRVKAQVELEKLRQKQNQ